VNNLTANPGLEQVLAAQIDRISSYVVNSKVEAMRVGEMQMTHREYHVMNAELIEDRLTMRYTCTTCQRCLEDRPEGITILHKGDPRASHRGGSLRNSSVEIEQVAPEKPVLH
jgi:hypothetical protein